MAIATVFKFAILLVGINCDINMSKPFLIIGQ